MWALDNRTPYGAERNWIRDKDGRHHWVVAVKATFNISTEGNLTLADEQPPPALAPEYTGKPGASSLRWDSDLLYAKPCTDVIAEASAYAPDGRARESVPVALRVGDLQKQLWVHGSRGYYRGMSPGLSITNPAPFTVQPIRYELAYGGFDQTPADPSQHRLDDRNPIGRGFCVDVRRWENQPAHQIEYPSGDVKKVGPAGFGAIDCAWLPRRRYGGTYDSGWIRSKKPLLPDDFDALYGSAAPADQQIHPYLHAGASVELQNLTPEGRLCFTLPKIGLTYETHFGDRREAHRGHLVTVLLLPDARQVALVWQTTLYVAPRDSDYLDKTVIGEKRYV